MNADREEHWLPVVGAPGYRVSDLGRVWSVDRYIADSRGWQRHIQGGELKPVMGRSGYLQFGLSVNGTHQIHAVHEIVLTAFAGPRPDGMQGCHGPAGKLVNIWPDNLCWGTPKQNAADRHRDGTMLIGESHPSAKLTVEVVRLCRQRYAAGETTSALAREHGVTRRTMQQLVNCETWRHVTDTPAEIPEQPGPLIQGELFTIGGDPGVS